MVLREYPASLPFVVLISPAENDVRLYPEGKKQTGRIRSRKMEGLNHEIKGYGTYSAGY
jgi:hypothetical protein